MEKITIYICEKCMHWFYPNYPLPFCNICEDKPVLKILFCYDYLKLTDFRKENE